jgi:hypothetical protein
MGQTSEEMVRDNFLRHSGAKKGAATMLALNDQSRPPPAARDTLADLLQVIADPKGAKARLDQLDAATKAHAEKISAAAEAEKKLADIESELKAKRAAHQGELDHERELAEKDLARRHDAMVATERAIQSRRDEADKLHADATKLKAEWVEKTRKLKELQAALA